METDTIKLVLNYRLLPTEEWKRVEDIFQWHGQNLPMKETSLISVAEYENEVEALLCFQPIMHGEPFWVDEDFRGAVDVRKLQKSLTDVLPKGLEYFAFTPSRKMRWVAGTCGMKPMPWDIWKGVV